MQGEMDKTDGHFYIDYEGGLFRAIQFDPENLKDWAIAEESSSLEDLIKQCHESGLTHLVSMKRSAIDRIREWLKDRPAYNYVENLWNGDSDLTKNGPIGFITPP